MRWTGKGSLHHPLGLVWPVDGHGHDINHVQAEALQVILGSAWPPVVPRGQHVPNGAASSAWVPEGEESVTEPRQPTHCQYVT